MTSTTARAPFASLDSASPHPIAAAARGLVKAYQTGETEIRALDSVDVDIETGRLTAAMGASGSGKSTLMHCLAGLDRPTEGQVFLGRTDLTPLDDTALTVLRRTRIGFVFQSFNLLPTLTAEQNIRLPLRLAHRGVDADWFRTVVSTLGLTDRLTHRPGQLSGGQQQRVAMARALITRPDLVVADEPTGALDSRSSDQLLAFLRTLVREFGQTVLLVTHDPGVAAFADRVLVLHDGRLVRDLREPTPDALRDAVRDGGR
ncbi:MAG: ABC transporter ATP-binding protein [Phycicoccus sp.]|nr:ABC transporter ATP-binding protein [Phycicoccus sp.]